MRKRTVKILRDIFVVGCQVANEVRVSNKTVDANSLSHSTEMMVDIVIKLLSRINDEESSVKVCVRADWRLGFLSKTTLFFFCILGPGIQVAAGNAVYRFFSCVS